MKKRVDILYNFAIFLLALTFVFSGFVKIVDPWGGALKIEEYLYVYGLGWVSQLSMFFSILLSGTELAMGLLLLFRCFTRPLSALYLGAMLFFTAVSLLSATILPIKDCGCFGDALKLTAWQTFFKNIPLLAISIWFFLRSYSQKTTPKMQFVPHVLILAVSYGLGLYAFYTMPIIDFLPYRVGVNLKGDFDKGVHDNDVEVILVYRDKSSGEIRKFSIEDLEWRDSQRWEWVETITKGGSNESEIESSLEDFKLYSLDGEDVTEKLLSSEKPFNLIIVREFERLGDRSITKIKTFANEAISRGELIYVVSSQDVDLDEYGLLMELLSIDGVTSKMLLRPSAGVVVIRDGVITSKRRLGNL